MFHTGRTDELMNIPNFLKSRKCVISYILYLKYAMYSRQKLILTCQIFCIFLMWIERLQDDIIQTKMKLGDINKLQKLMYERTFCV